MEEGKPWWTNYLNLATGGLEAIIRVFTCDSHSYNMALGFWDLTSSKLN
jgi:hypothetical protein